MRYILLVVGIILALIVAGVFTILWHRWSLYVHFFEKKLLVEIRGFGLKRRLMYRDFSKEKKPSKKKKATTKKGGKSSFKERFKFDKKKIYDKEKGGYQPDGISDTVNMYLDGYRELKDIFRKFFDDIHHKIEIPSTEISLEYGTGNPAHTGMLYGTIWGIVGMAYPLISRHIKMAYPIIELKPDFYAVAFNLEIKSIIRVRPAHIINALIKECGRQAVTYLYNHFTKGSVKNG